MALLATAMSVACGANAPADGSSAPKRDDTRPRQVLPNQQVYVLEATGIAPTDTTITFPQGQARSIILRHGPPDNTVFVELHLPDSAFASPRDSLLPPDSVRIELRPMPGQYRLDVSTSMTPRRGATIRFKYPVHFAAPIAAIERYQTRTRFERALMVGIRVDSATVGLYESERPSSDNLQAPFLGSGTYLVAAPR